MLKFATTRVIAVAVGMLALAGSSQGAVIKLQLGEVGPDVAMNANGVFGTVNDGNAVTFGDQNTAIEFTGPLNFLPDVPLNVASFTLRGVQAIGFAAVSGNVVVQSMGGGAFELYDPANVLLLSGTLNTSALTGSLGVPGTGSLFTTTLGTPTGGTLAPLFAPGSISLSLEMTHINNGAGLAVGAAAPILLPFEGDATLSIEGTIVPEPASVSAVALGGVVAAGMRRRRAK